MSDKLIEIILDFATNMALIGAVFYLGRAIHFSYKSKMLRTELGSERNADSEECVSEQEYKIKEIAHDCKILFEKYPDTPKVMGGENMDDVMAAIRLFQRSPFWRKMFKMKNDKGVKNAIDYVHKIVCFK